MKCKVYYNNFIGWVKRIKEGMVRMKKGSVRAVERAAQILKIFSIDESKLSLSDIAARTGLPLTTALRLVKTLEELNMLQQNEDKTYSLGSLVYLLGSVARSNFKPQQIIYPYMKAIRDETKEAVSLYGVEGEHRVCFMHVESLLSMRCVMRVGDRAQLWAGAGGKALLAFLKEEIIERELKKTYPITPTTIHDPDALRKELEEIRRLGYAVSWGEREEGIFSIAVPIFDRYGNVIFSFSVAGPATRFTEEIGMALIPRIKKMCEEIGARL